ncbi:MAG TPA: carbohydrate ABC transporter permease [Chloroflexota bacterium]|nr:carbohydrate ABC transporter permease [Chloroflexota bacterium]
MIARKLEALPLHLAILALCCLWLVPAVGLLVSSFRPPNLVATSGWWTAFLPPFTFTSENYEKVLSTYNMGPSFVNSLVITVPATVIPLLIAAYAAYAFAWMRFPGRDWLFLVVVGLLVVPLQTTFIPVLTLFVQLHLTGNFLGLWLAHTGYGLPLAIYLLRNFIGSLPKDIFESALIDGAGHWTMFFRIVLPTSVAALASLAIFQFLWVWNDLLVALIYLGGQPSVAPVTVTISNLVSSLGQGWQLLTAAASISMALPLLVFFSLQRYFARGLLAGALKG